MAVGSGLMDKLKADVPHVGANHAVGDLRKDVEAALAPLAAIAVQEFTNPVASAAAGLLAATATTVAVQTYVPSQLVAGGIAALLAYPRNVTFTTAGVTPADAPATATIVGTDINDMPQTETVNIAQTATIASGVKAFKTIKSITYAAGDGTAATVSIGFGAVFGLHRKPKSRAGLLAAIKEIAVGAVVTTGTLNATNNTYAPATAPDAANDYCVYYEYDPNA